MCEELAYTTCHPEHRRRIPALSKEILRDAQHDRHSDNIK